MAFTVTDVQDLIRLLAQHPEWRAELRPLILGDELLRLPDLVRENTEAIRELRAETAEMRETIGELGEQTAENTRAIGELRASIVELREQTAENTSAIGELRAAVQELVGVTKVQGDLLGRHEGELLEIRYFNRIRSYLGLRLLRSQVLSLPELDGIYEAVAAGKISETDLAALAETDLLVSGRLRDSGAHVVLAIEVSSTIRRSDLERAEARARILKAAGFDGVPVVAGMIIHPADRRRAEESRVAVLLDSRIDYWPEAA